MIINKNDKDEIKKYNEFVLNSRYGNIMQDSHWSNLKPSWTSEYVIIKEEKVIKASMLILFRKIFGKYTIAYCPRGPVCDSYDIDVIKKLIVEVLPLLKKNNSFVLKFDPDVLYDSELEKLYIENGFKIRNTNCNTRSLIQPIYNMRLSLNKSFEDLLKDFKVNTRANIKKAYKRGVEVNYYKNEESLKIFYDLYLETSKRDNFSPRPYSYFKLMFDNYFDYIRIYISSFEKEPLSASIALNYGKSLWYIYGASTSKRRDLFPCYAMHKAMIEWGIETNKEVYDFGGVHNIINEDGVYRFKHGFCKDEGTQILIGEINYVINNGFYYLYNALYYVMHKIRTRHEKLKK